MNKKALKVEKSDIPDLPFSRQDIYFTAATSKDETLFIASSSDLGEIQLHSFDIKESNQWKPLDSLKADNLKDFQMTIRGKHLYLIGG
jgi:hypothetical protein